VQYASETVNNLYGLEEQKVTHFEA